MRVPLFCFIVGWLVCSRRVGWMWLNVQCADDGYFSHSGLLGEDEDRMGPQISASASSSAPSVTPASSTTTISRNLPQPFRNVTTVFITSYTATAFFSPVSTLDLTPAPSLATYIADVLSPSTSTITPQADTATPIFSPVETLLEPAMRVTIADTATAIGRRGGELRWIMMG